MALDAARVRDREPREHTELQRELLQELHDDHARELEARLVEFLERQQQRARDAAGQSHGLRRSIDALLPFIIGLIIGVLATYGAFSGRISTLEAVTAQHTTAIREQREDFNAYAARTATAIENINEKLSTRGTR